MLVILTVAVTMLRVSRHSLNDFSYREYMLAVPYIEHCLPSSLLLSFLFFFFETGSPYIALAALELSM